MASILGESKGTSSGRTSVVTGVCGERPDTLENPTWYQFQSLRHCLTGGEALNPDVREKWKSQTGLELHEGYGQSETVVICANPKGTKIKSGSMGKASPPYDVQIVDDEGNILPPGAEGNVAVRVRPARPFCFFNCYL
ncbi:acyl-coenzyme A synthetase ACSM5, mitochondrial-like, partial [Equus quagga]|uniref:acyl-coenzyme A synthetase ACSM5, mitochondrial-like n=1 Tax=Equus quagga TaxID=89248 RepID=UPI001EE16290